MIRIGVDVGGTNTDAVIMENDRLLAGVKRPTTPDVTSGVKAAIEAVIEKAALQSDQIEAVMIGTTHFINAIVQRKSLSPTGIIRMCLPSGTSLRPFADWPEDLVSALNGQAVLVDGGYEMDGREISPLNRDQLIQAAQTLLDAGCHQIALSAVFASIRNDMELEAADILAEEFPELSITKSSDIGRIGLLERENAAIINATLMPLAQEVVTAFEVLKSQLGLRCSFYFTRNDGTLVEAEEVRRLPVLTFACGPTNSMRGAAFLSGEKNALVVDIGGTTTDVGEVIDGFPRLAGTSVSVADVQTNFSMPDVISVGLGGGSIIRQKEGLSIGPGSVGHRLTQEAVIFGGATCTASDLATAVGRCEMGDTAPPPFEDRDELLKIMDEIIVDAVARARTSDVAMPVLAVGGGSVLLPSKVDGLEVIRPDHFDLANAVGAAIAQVSGEASKIVQLSEKLDRMEAMKIVEEEARARAISRGAVPGSIAVMSKSDVPLSYLPGENLSISVTVVGDLNLEYAA